MIHPLVVKAYGELTEEQRCALDRVMIEYPEHVIRCITPHSSTRFPFRWIRADSELHTSVYLDWDGTMWVPDDGEL